VTSLFGVSLDALTLFLVLTFGLSVVVAYASVPKGEAEASARHAKRLLFTPPLAALALLALGFWPSLRAALGVAADHCTESGASAHPHLCWLHTVAESANTAHDVAAVVVVTIMAALGAWHAFHWGSALGRLRLLESLAVPHREAEVRAALAAAEVPWMGDITVVSFDLPMCFVVGVRSPRLMISTAVLDDLPGDDLQVIIAHEAAHLERKDNLWRLVGQFALLFHLPGLGRRTFQRWVLSAESACDDHAARRFGSRVAVAEALVRFQRLAQTRGNAPSLGAAFGDADALESRVRLLLDPPSPSAKPWFMTWWPVAALVVTAWQVDALHAALEGLLFLLHL
jgi:Zn-dependent protease with chaperone function